MPPPLKRKKADAGLERTSPTSHAVTEDEYSVVYSKGESVWAYWKDKWFQSKIMGTSSCRHPHDKNRSVLGYKVHYANWGSKYDEWVMSDCLMARSAENDLRAKAENEGRLEKCARAPKSGNLAEKPGDAVSDGRDLQVANKPAPEKRLKEEPKKEPKKEPAVEPSRPVTRNGGQKQPAQTPESKPQRDVPQEALPKNAQKEVHVELSEKKPKKEAPASGSEKKMEKDGPVTKTDKKAAVPAAVSQSAKPKKPRADSPEIECLGSGTFTAFHSDIPAEEEEEIPTPVVRTKKTKQVKRLSGSTNPVKSTKEVKKEARKSTKATPTKPPLKKPAAVKLPVASKVVSRDSSPEISAPPKPPKRLKVDEKVVRDTLTESIAETVAWESNCTQCTSQQQCKLHAAASASGYSTKTNAREVMKAAGEASKEVPIYTTKTNGSLIVKPLPVPKTLKEATKEPAKVVQKLTGSSPVGPSTTSAVTKSAKPKELKLGDKVVAVQVVDTQATTSNSLIGTKQISVNGKQTKLVLKCAPAKREDKRSPRDVVALKSIVKTPVKIFTVKSATSSAKGANKQKPKGCVVTGTNTQPTASVVIPLHLASPTQLSTPAGQLGTPVTAKCSPTVTTKMAVGKVALPLKAGVTVGRSSQVPTVLKKSPAATVTPPAKVPPAPVVVNPEEIKRKEKGEKEKERSKQVAAGLISLLAVSVKAPNATGMLAKAFQEKMAYADEELDNVSRAGLHHIFVKHIAFGTISIRKQADERWLLSEEPHMAAVPFLKSLTTYAIQGLNIRKYRISI
ncbi:hypothetical protein RvY_07226 [Ramazzottius varieornatus]|uniref:MSL3 chromodomain-like domain-containing protein n=1 Tax=Ramazzottius varieornatus TaxID=947166 RepID=A0A1D1V3Z8_RAMVA|nr:hypothetical protein RvY_07226 [Ramazzottius varieornatus]